MSASTYWELLKRPEWQKRRLERLSECEFACQACYNTESQLHVHHKRYVKGRKPWEYEDFELAVLCDSCHTFAHEEINRVNEIFAHLHYDGPQSHHCAMALISGFFSGLIPDNLITENYDLTGDYHYGIGGLAKIAFHAVHPTELKEASKVGLSKEAIFQITKDRKSVV